MLDIIIALFAAEAVPIISLISLAYKSELVGEAATIAALETLGRGSIQAGLLFLIIIQPLVMPLAMGAVRLFYRWMFRNTCCTADDTNDTIETIKTLPVSSYMRQKVFDDVIQRFMKNVKARAKAIREQNSILP